jgi:hypothetical protein
MAVKHVQEGNDVNDLEIIALTRHLYKQAKQAWSRLSKPKSLLWVDLSNTGRTRLSERWAISEITTREDAEQLTNSPEPSDA